ncbi:MAG: prepilin peptidase [Proteobacteria bacterium]|nr:prepilin peptidase [Pseudomonadota bacterium]
MSPLLITVHWMVAAVYPLALVWAVTSDVRHLIIPNWTCIAIAAAFLPAALLQGLDYSAIAWHYGAGMALILAGMILFARNLIGGGDLKLLAAAGVWIGWSGLWPYLLLVTLLGGALAMAVLIARKFKRKIPLISHEDVGGAHPVPYGVAIGVAAIIMFSKNPALPQSWTTVLGALPLP